MAALRALLGLILLLPAQEVPKNGSITGVVTDGQGGVIPGATITAIANGKSTTAVSDRTGGYSIVGLEWAKYDVIAALDGFRRSTKCEALNVGASVAHCDLVLSVSGPPVPQSDPRYQALLAAEGRWRSAAIRSYEYKASVRCFCGFDATPFPIRVVDGAPQPIQMKNSWISRAGEHYDTVEKLFALIRTALNQGYDLVDVTYDTANGRPIFINLDLSRNGEDDDVSIAVFEFKIR